VYRHSKIVVKRGERLLYKCDLRYVEGKWRASLLLSRPADGTFPQRWE